MGNVSGESLVYGNLYFRWPRTRDCSCLNFPGQILEFDLLKGDEWICQKSSFLVGEPSIHLNVEWTKRLSAGLLGGEGFILQRISGQGKVFLEAAGSVVKRELKHGEIIKVDTGNVVAFSRGVNYEIETVKGLKTFFGGEGTVLN